MSPYKACYISSLILPSNSNLDKYKLTDSCLVFAFLYTLSLKLSHWATSPSLHSLADL